PIELACNETIADAFEARTGEDDFECRLPNAFLADPPLEQVVARSYEAGVRGEWNEINYRFGYFHTENQDDIIFQSTGRTTGLFKNVDETLRQGVETAFAGTLGSFDWSLSYSYIEATFEDDFLTLSPNHDFAADLNGNGDAAEIQVNKGDRIPGLPEHILKLGGDYRFAGGFTLGGEVVYNSDQALRADESNQLDTVGGYAVVNLRASYRVSERFELFARVTNLFDEDFENFGLLGEDPTELEPLEGVISNPSPRFLGIGAPRGGWVGLRVRI
ncbi:MAG: TonB-dependent receptor, partial [Gammaproteobacteria bacterium]|nr:TonB-dependent receptor [Gammaproteobacteria bacterium]